MQWRILPIHHAHSAIRSSSSGPYGAMASAVANRPNASPHAYRDAASRASGSVEVSVTGPVSQESRGSSLTDPWRHNGTVSPSADPDEDVPSERPPVILAVDDDPEAIELIGG